MPVADLLCFGARADVVAAAEHALASGAPANDAPILDGIEALELTLLDDPSDMFRAVTVAEAHMDIGWAWRGTGWLDEVPRCSLRAFEAHFDRARDILMPFQKTAPTSPICLSAWCGLNGASLAPDARVSRDYEQLIDLNPANPGPMRALGNYLSPRWYGSHEELELQARRTAARTHNDWGAGAYTWVMFDALPGDSVACANLDIEFFIDGLHDILTRRADQHTANLLAAFCAHTIGQYKTGIPRADDNRAQIADCAHWIVRKHLKEVHPLVWAHAAVGFDNSTRVASTRRFAAQGRKNALQVIAALFQREIEDGRRIVFTANGPVAEQN
ncbi:MAG: hypothetical protein AAF665_00905 [Pseudomonadota bacterium]